jgi:general secretion pathway protein M
MIRRPSPILRRIAALGLLGALLLAGWIGLVQPAARLWAGDAEADAAAADRLARLTAIAGQLPLLERRVRALDAALAEPGLLWPGASAALISAAIQGQLRQVVTEAGGSVHSTAELAAAPEHGLVRVGLRIDAEGTVETLQRTLYAIETAAPALVIDDLLVSAPEGWPVNAGHAPVLSIRLDVAGYGRSG